MKIYLVGGAVRDALINENIMKFNTKQKIEIKDRDWVVVNATPKTMEKLGFHPVGSDFPVFIHPKTKEEYALARTERKSGKGYKGFTCYTKDDVTLEEDLLRRDLTINAIAQSDNGEIIDPYNGQEDIKNKRLRHVSEAFIEDPLRVLRVARFAARFHHLGFTIAEETMQLMKQLVSSGELSLLTPERVWKEWHKSLSSGHPEVFLKILRKCGALAVILPEIDRLFGVPQKEKWHPEVDTGIHTLMVSQQAALLSDSATVRFAAQLHDLGKSITPKSEWPSHKMHHITGINIIKSLYSRLRIPKEYGTLALLVCEHHTTIHQARELDSKTFINLFDKMDLWRKPERLNDILLCCQADHAGRLGFESHPYPQKTLIEQAFQAANKVDVKQIIEEGFKGQSIRDELTRKRRQRVDILLSKNKPSK